jgi:hypothetical protein
MLFLKLFFARKYIKIIFFLFLNFILDISALKQLKKSTKLIFKKKTLNFFKIQFNCTPVVVVVFHCHVRTYLS